MTQHQFNQLVRHVGHYAMIAISMCIVLVYVDLGGLGLFAIAVGLTLLVMGLHLALQWNRWGIHDTARPAHRREDGSTDWNEIGHDAFRPRGRRPDGSDASGGGDGWGWGGDCGGDGD